MSIFLWACKEEPQAIVSKQKVEEPKLKKDTIPTSVVRADTSASILSSKIDKEEKEKHKAKDETITEIKKQTKELAKAHVIKSAPLIKFENEFYDFGRIVQGEKVSHEFLFINKGNAPLVIKNAEASCGCTQPIYPFVPIEPGEKGTILVQFKSAGRLGRQAPSIKIISNGQPSIVTLKLQGEVITEQFQDTIRQN